VGKNDAKRGVNVRGAVKGGRKGKEVWKRDKNPPSPPKKKSGKTKKGMGEGGTPAEGCKEGSRET